jgi:hypothetical protein
MARFFRARIGVSPDRIIFRREYVVSSHRENHMRSTGDRTVRSTLLVLTAVVVAAVVGVTPASAEAKNVVETNTWVGGAVTTTCSGTLDSTPFSVPNAGDYLFVNMGAKTTTPVGTPTDSLGNTFTLVGSSSTGGTETGRWVGLWMTKSKAATGSGQDVVSWPCDGLYMAGSVLATFTATGPQHLIQVDVSGVNTWNDSATETATTSARTTATGDLVLAAGYTRQGVLIRNPGSSSASYNYVNGVGQTSGTEFSSFNTTTVDPTYARGSIPWDTVNFGDVTRTCNPRCTPKPTYGASVIVAFKST